MSEPMVEIKVGRFDNLRNVAVPEGASLSEALNKIGITLSETEKVNNLEGDAVDLSEDVENGSTYVIVDSYKSGKQ